jgi:hypothetical protein
MSLAVRFENRSDVSSFFLKLETARWGSEHLVESARSARLYLVIRDRISHLPRIEFNKYLVYI